MLHSAAGRLLAGGILAFISMGGILSAQSINGGISGKVSDQTGGVIQGAGVVVRNLDTGSTREARTDSSGEYRVNALPVGRYAVEVTASGFEKYIRQPIDVDVAVNREVDVTVTPGSTQSVVTVQSEAPLIESNESQLTKTVETLRILELPGNPSRDALALLQPGAVENQNGRPGSGFSVNGGRSRSNDFTIDGANNNDQTLSTPRLNLASEYLGEFQIITNNFAAEYGRNSGTIVNQITRSGSNEFHGIERWEWLGNGYNALTTGQKRTFLANKANGLSDYLALRKSRAVTVENIGVFSVGGPVVKDRSFFFAGYDIDRFRTTAVPTTVAISPAGMSLLQQNASLFAPNALSALQSEFPMANDPTARGSITVNAGGKALVVPLAQLSPGLNTPLSYATNNVRGLIKSDNRLTSKNTLSGRYAILDSADPGSPSAIPNNSVGQNLRDQSATLNDTHVFSPEVLNEARISYIRRSLQFPQNFPEAVSITGFNSTGNINYPQFRVDNDWEYTDNLTITKGHHTFKTGFNLYHSNLNSFFAPLLLGSVTYNSLQDYLLDNNATYQKFLGNAQFDAITNEFGGFFQDDWRLLPNFTLNIGLRYEYTGTPFGFFSNAKPDINNFGPRFGFAWAPSGGKTSIRGGFSMAYDQIFQNILLNDSRNFPRGYNYAISNISGKQLYLSANQPSVPTPDQLVNTPGFNANTLDYRNYSPNQRVTQPYTLQFSMGVERQLTRDVAVKLFYVGTRGVKLVQERESNFGFYTSAVNNAAALGLGTFNSVLPYLTPVPLTIVSPSAIRLYPQLGSRGIGGGFSESSYHSMQLSVEKRFSHGFVITGNYTYSSFIDNSDDILGGATNNTLPMLPFNSQDRARSGFDQPQRLVVNYVYQVPYKRDQQGMFGRIVGGWELSGLTQLNSGTPYTIYNGGNPIGVLPSGGLTAIQTLQRPDYSPTGAFLPGQIQVPGTPFIFNPNNSGIIGNLGRNTQRTGGTETYNLAAVKNIRLVRESQSIQLRWEVLNALNHRNFTVIPSNTVTATTNLTLFNNLGQTNVGGRTMTFQARFIF